MSETSSLILTGEAHTGQSQTYTHLPFDVPESTTRIEVRYTYSDEVGSDPQLTDGNTVDIGIFDPRGIDFMVAGFRGWSGSARAEFFIAHNEATPGYLPGPIQPGTWHICLGLYKIAPQGCHYQVEITLTCEDVSQEVEFPALLPVRSAANKTHSDGWYCGEMHCHTVHSDGDSDPLEVIQRAETLGLDFLAITDHNVLSHLARLHTLDTSLVLIPGFEVTTYKGHWNVWGDHGWIDFRVESEQHMAQAVAEATRRGYVVSCNHPRPHGPDWVYEGVDNFDCIEVWNGEWALFNEVALEFWESRLRTGKRYTAVGGSDCHFLHRDHIAKLARPTLWVYCPDGLSAPAVLAALHAGHVMISESPAGPRLSLHAQGAMMGDVLSTVSRERLAITAHVINGTGSTLQVCTAAGCIFEEAVPSQAHECTTEADITGTPYLRVQLVDKETSFVRAFTNPIYIN